MSKFKKYLFPLLLIVLTGTICFLNYSPNTYLTGWDTLHPEFDFSLNFKRLFNLWHSEQGLGAIPAHAQMADLPRVIILYLFHFILPLSFLRYSYIFLCFILGPLGIYFLIKNIFKKNNHQDLIAFLASLFYIFNLSTVQQFYVPFEMFPTQWAFLPWIILFSIKYLKNKNKKDLILFSVFTIFATPQAYAAQLWYAFFAIYSSFLFVYSFLKKDFKPAIKLFLFTLLLNAFWLIPNIFYIITSSDAPKINRDNRLYSQEFLLKNRQNGYLSSSTIVKGFYLDWSVYNFDKGSFEDLMPQWNEHLSHFYIVSIGYILFIICLIGLIISFFKKDKLFISFSPFFIIPFILLSNKVPVFSQFFDLLIKNDTIKESFRFIFTKLSILFIFGLVIFFSYSISLLFEKIKTFKIICISSVLIIISLIIYAFPIFQGYLISPKVRINIPTEYFQMWQFMKTQDDGRVLSLPLNQSSGWQYYDWGYQGSGFIWFNLKQDILDRDSDRWNDKNEQSYKEFFNSLYSQNFQNFSQTLNKYQIKYIIWDQNVMSSSEKNNDQVTFKNEIYYLLSQLENQNLIIKTNEFGSIYVYQINNSLSSSPSKTETISNFVQPQYQWGYVDTANQTDYISDNNNGSYFPFRDLLNKNQKIDTNKINISELNENQWQISLKSNNQTLNIPNINSTENIISAGVYLIKDQNKLTLKFELPFSQEVLNSLKTEFEISNTATQIKINDNIFPINTEIFSDKKYLGIVYLYVNSDNFLNDQIINFNFNESKNITAEKIIFNSNVFNFNDQQYFKNYNNDQNYTLEIPKVPHNLGYIIGIKNKYTSGIPLRFCLRNNYSFTCTIEDELNKNKDLSWDYFLIPPTGSDSGYQLSLTNYSYGSETSESTVEKIVIIPLPFNLLSQIKSDNLDNTSKDFTILNQSYNKFWVAFYFKNGIPILFKNHVLANNWANAWEIPENYNQSSKIYVIFWPQLLEFIGFGLTIFAIVWSFKKTKQ